MNWQVFGSRSNLLSIPDGLSSTLATAEHYAYCGSMYNGPVMPSVDLYFSDALVSWSMGYGYPASFAGEGRVYPVTNGDPPVSIGNDLKKPQLTFQLRPRQPSCDMSLAQTPHLLGMVVTLFDGSVRVLKGDISPAVYWGATTLNRGEIINLD
jgi:hypothetical protein